MIYGPQYRTLPNGQPNPHYTPGLSELGNIFSAPALHLNDFARKITDPVIKTAANIPVQMFNVLSSGKGGPNIMDVKPAAKPAPVPEAMTRLGFVGAPPAGAITAPAAPDASSVGALLTEMFGAPVTVTSTTRSAEHNKEVGGVPNSMHLTGQAADVVPQGMSLTDAAKKAKASGLFTEVINEGDHLHVGWRPGQQTFGMASSAVAPGAAGVAGPQAFLDPRIAMGMIPNPTPIPSMKLPDFIPADLPPAPSPRQTIDPAMLAPITAAAAVKAPDTSHNGWERVQSMLAAAAQAAAGADPRRGFGSMIAAAGGAAGAAGIGERRAQEAEVKQYEEANRQAQLMLAKLGFDVGSQNVGIQNENLGISDAGKLRDYTVAQGNKQGPRNTAVQQMEQDWKAAAENIQAQNRTNTTRGQVGISAMDAAASAQNRATTRQEEITASGANKGHELDTQSLLDSVGVPRNLAAKDQAKYAPAVAAASALHPSTQNIDAALNALADELADPKFADLVLSSAPGEPKPETAAKKAAMEAISPRQGLKANPPAAAATISALFASARQRPNGDSELYEKVIKPAAARGSYVAKLLLKKVAPQKVPAGAK